MQAIKDTVWEVMRALKTKKTKEPNNNPEALLKKTLTKKELRHIKFNYFKRGLLCLNVDSSVWLYQLSLKKENLLVKLGKTMPGIKDIRLRLGEVN